MKSVLNRRNELSAGAARSRVESGRSRAWGWRGLRLIRSVLLLSPVMKGVTKPLEVLPESPGWIECPTLGLSLFLHIICHTKSTFNMALLLLDCTFLQGNSVWKCSQLHQDLGEPLISGEI